MKKSRWLFQEKVPVNEMAWLIVQEIVLTKNYRFKLERTLTYNTVEKWSVKFARALNSHT